MTQYPVTTDIEYALFVALLQKYLRVPQSTNGTSGSSGHTITSVEYSIDLTVNEQAVLASIIERAGAIVNLNNLPNWASYTATQAESAITNSIFSGQTQAQVESSITTAITNAPATIAGLKTVMNTLFIQAADNIISIRGILVIFGRILVWLRDIVLNNL